MNRAMVGAAACMTLGFVLNPPVAGAACETVTIGVDSSYARNSAVSYLGRSSGQTFLTSDTLLKSLSVWRVASQAGAVIGMHLYITKTDSTGRPALRVGDRPVLDGPTVVNTGGDGIHPTLFRWDFDPPFALPGPGRYAFFLAQDPCLAYFDVVGPEEDSGLYPEGQLWLTGRQGCDVSFPTYVDSYPRADLCFLIEFCRDTTTSTRNQTWGKLKQIYR